LILYLDASALVKRYVAEPGSDTVRDAMQRAAGWFMARVGFVETVRAVSAVAGDAVARRFQQEWTAIGVIEVDQPLVERAGELATAHRLRSLDAIHLAAGMLLPRDELVLLTWDHRLAAAASAEGLEVLPAAS
jgi:uncharacterized protein